MRSGPIDIHHHYVPAEVAGKAKGQSKALGVEVTPVGKMEPCRFPSTADRGVAAAAAA
jgi:hypothetical protein